MKHVFTPFVQRKCNHDASKRMFDRRFEIDTLIFLDVAFLSHISTCWHITFLFPLLFHSWVLNSLDNMGADSRLLYYLIREIKTWLNINHITVHNNTYCIFSNSKNSYWKYKSYIINKLTIYIIYTCTHARMHAHTHTHTALTFERIYLFRNAIDCIRFWYMK